MMQGAFKIGDTNSQEINSFIQFLPEISSPKRKVQRRNVPGVSGEYIFDEDAYENTPINLELFAKARSTSTVQQLKDQITLSFMGGRYLDFTPYWDSDRVYQVEVIEPPAFLPNGNHPTSLFYTVGLSAKPFKADRSSLSVDPSTNVAVVNPYGYDNQPIITLIGTGDAELVVNNNKYVFKDIDGHLTVDSQIESAYKIIAGVPKSRNNRMFTKNFPVFKPGKNTVTVRGNEMRFKVETRWKTLVS